MVFDNDKKVANYENTKTPPSEGLPADKAGPGEALISEEVQDIISYRPHWIVRQGNAVFLGVVLALFALTWAIQYPDKIETPSRLVALNPPKLVAARTDGKIIRLFVSNDQAVKKGQHLAHLESTGKYEDIVQLHNWIEEALPFLQQNETAWLNKKPLPKLAGLGELQVTYQQFQNELEIMKQTMASGYYQRKKMALQKDLNYLASLNNITTQQKELVEQNKALDRAELEAYEKLAAEKVIAPMELNRYKEKLLAKELSLKQANAQVTNTDISSHGKRKEILDLDKQVADQRQQFYSSLLQLKSETEKWMQQYVLAAPEDGKLVFVSSLQENELVNNGQGLFYVQPGQTKYYAELMAGQRGFGKIKTGQRVILKAESYPATEFGYLQGSISHVSALAGRNDSFLIKVSLPQGLVTSYGKNIFFRNNLAAKAEIITDSRRLLDRLIGQLKTIWKK